MPHTLPIEVSTQDVKNILLTAPASHDDLFLLLDCREPDEHSTANIIQARLIPMGTIPSRLQELEPWRDKRIVVHCHHGMRSLRVAQWLREQCKGASMPGALLSIRQFPVISCVFQAIVLCRKNTEIISLRELLAAY